MRMWRKGFRRGKDGNPRGQRESEVTLRILTLLDKNKKTRLTSNQPGG